MAPSTRECPVVKISLHPHDNADSLSIITMEGLDYQCVGRTEDWKGKEKAVFIQPDSVVDTRRSEFSFLAKEGQTTPFQRITAKKLRGELSYGLLVPAPDWAEIGKDLCGYLQVEHWNETEHVTTGGEAEKPPTTFAPCYDVENFKKYGRKVFSDSEPVFITVKINGSNTRFTYADNKMNVGSKNEWKRQSDDNLWWSTLKKYPQIERFCKENPGLVLYAENYGHIGNWYYGPSKDCRYAAFDILNGQDGKYLDSEDLVKMCELYEIPMVPILHKSFAYDWQKLVDMAEISPSLVHRMQEYDEGICVRPIKERVHPKLGRTHLKIISNNYLLKAK